jgi:prepilin-type N-terminal cleavage/methylation domain-containing protein
MLERARLRARRAVEAQDGFTLAEMLVVLAILGIVLAGLTQLFTGALFAQRDQTNRTRAQQDARLALDQLRRELHCGSALAYSAASITVALPSYCASSPRTSLSGAVTLPVGTITVAGTDRFNSGTNTISFGSSGSVTCSGKTSTSFTGCSGGATGTYPSGTTVTSPVTWCATTTGPPYTLKRYATDASVPGASCTGAGGTSSTTWLVSSSVFSSYTRTAIVPAPTFTATPGGRIQPGTYAYDVTAVTANGEFSGTPSQTTVPAGSTSNTLTLSWSAYTDPTGAAATSYRVYGRDNGSTTAEGLRLLATVTAPTTSWTDTGPPLTTLSGGLSLPNGTIPVVDTSTFTWSPNTISFGPSGTVTCSGKTSTSFTGCNGGLAGTYPAGTNVFQDRTFGSPVDGAPPLATLNVALVLDQTPADASQRFTLTDAISLRNSGRF